MNIAAIAEDKIKRSSTVKIHKLAAIAMTKNGHFICCETNRQGEGIVSDFSLHAEEFLVKKLKKINANIRYNNIIVVVMRQKRSGGFGMAKPCARCEGLLVGYGVKEVHYTDESGRITRLKGI